VVLGVAGGVAWLERERSDLRPIVLAVDVVEVFESSEADDNDERRRDDLKAVDAIVATETKLSLYTRKARRQIIVEIHIICNFLPCIS
jgi:hypothetical protein